MGRAGGTAGGWPPKSGRGSVPSGDWDPRPRPAQRTHRFEHAMPADRSLCATGHAAGPWAMATASESPSLGLIKAFLGPSPAHVELDAEEMEQVDCGSYIRWKIRYSVAPGERVTAFVCVPKEAETPTAAVFCHHQHAGKFALGKSEVVGLAGDPDQAYASELAEQGFITIAPDAIGFEERNWSSGRSENISWFELSTRLVRGQTLLASCLHDISVALDYLVSGPEVDFERIGFIGHSYGGRADLWAAAFDQRIRASVSHCGCIPYRLSFTHDTGLQAEFVVPGFAQQGYPSEPTSLRQGGSRQGRLARGRSKLGGWPRFPGGADRTVFGLERAMSCW